jgi:hypothetical protein
MHATAATATMPAARAYSTRSCFESSVSFANLPLGSPEYLHKLSYQRHVF